MSSDFGQIPLLTTELAALEGLRNQWHHFYSIAIGQIHLKTKACILSRTSSNFGQIGQLTTELADLERQKVDVSPFFGCY